MTEFSFQPSILDGLRDKWLSLANLLPDQLKATALAVENAARDAELLYADYLTGHPVPGHGQLKAPAVLKGTTICRAMAPVLWSIGHEDDKARFLDIDQPRRDMKESIRESKKARLGRNGAMYLIIPFRHGSNDDKPTRGIRPMPKEVYKLAATMSFSYHHGQVGTRLSATGHVVPLYGYTWGDKLPGGLAGKLKPHHRGDIYAGMYRFKDEATVGQQRSAGYITFRTMSENSRPGSWIRPATKGLDMLQTAIDKSIEANREQIQAALDDDLLSVCL